MGCLPTELEGGLDSIRVQLTKVRLEDAGVLGEDGGGRRDYGVQSVKEDETDGHRSLTKGMIINSGQGIGNALVLVIWAPRGQSRAEGAGG